MKGVSKLSDALDPALLRSGRIDYELEFRAAVPEQIRRLFLRRGLETPRSQAFKGLKRL